jgi:hypothetical protein
MYCSAFFANSADLSAIAAPNPYFTLIAIRILVTSMIYQFSSAGGSGIGYRDKVYFLQEAFSAFDND